MFLQTLQLPPSFTMKMAIAISPETNAHVQNTTQLNPIIQSYTLHSGSKIPKDKNLPIVHNKTQASIHK
jgi:hypothetical protein